MQRNLAHEPNSSQDLSSFQRHLLKRFSLREIGPEALGFGSWLAVLVLDWEEVLFRTYQLPLDLFHEVASELLQTGHLETLSDGRIELSDKGMEVGRQLMEAQGGMQHASYILHP